MADPSGSINNHAFGGIGNTFAWLKDDDKDGLGVSGAASVAMGSAEAFQQKYGVNNVFDADKIRPENV